MYEALIINGEPTAQQKHWISLAIGDKVVTKLYACICATQSLMQGQQFHQQETSVLGHRILSIKTKLDILLQHLKTPPNLSSPDKASFESLDKDDASADAICLPLTPSLPLPGSFSTPLPCSAPTDWFQLSFDPAKNSKGRACKKAPPQKMIKGPFSGDNITAQDYWNNFFNGSPGKPALIVLEETDTSSWRSDSKFQNLDSKKGTALKSAWSLQKPIYYQIEFLRGLRLDNVAVVMLQEVFDLFPYKHSKRPNLVKCKKEFVLHWGFSTQ
jgi:hypothetical protein